MGEFLSRLFKGDKVIWIIFLLLCVVSIVEGFSAMGQLSYGKPNYWTPIFRHAGFIFVGFGLVLLLHNLHYRVASVFILLLPIAAVLLVVTLFFGEKTNDASRWLNIFGFTFQPSEMAKLSTVVFVAFMLSRRRPENEKNIFWWVVGVTGGVCTLIFPDNFSTALLLFSVVTLLLFIAQLQLKKLFLLLGIFLLAGGLSMYALRNLPDSALNTVYEAIPRLETWHSRLERFGEETPADPALYKITDKNRQVTHAKIAIANGGLIGQGPGYSKQRDFLPQPYSDFIYAIIFEELGLIGAVFIMLLYFWLLFRVGLMARKCTRNYPRYLLFGCTLMLVMQALINMAVVVGLFPVTGQPLPMISRGGTSIVITCIYFAVILSVSRFEIGLGEEEEEIEEDFMSEKISDAEILSQPDIIPNN